MTHLSELIAALRKGDGNGCERSNWLMQEAADALMANQGAIVNSIIERTRHEANDDEREALDYAIRCAIPNDLDYRPLWKLIRAIQDAVLAAGFRRSEVPEPSATELRQVQYDDGSWSRTLEGGPAVSDDGWSTKDRGEAIAEGEPSDAQLQLDESEQCRDCGSYACDCSSTLTADQFEDAQIHEALRAAHEGAPGIVISYEAMRAALRAAWGVR